MSGVAAGLFWGALIVALWLVGKRKAGTQGAIAADRPDLQYSVYTHDFDCEIEANELRARIVADGDDGNPPQGFLGVDLAERRGGFHTSLNSAREQLRSKQTDMSGRAVCVLLDLSGSMAARLPSVLGELRALVEWCRDNGATVAVLGFTTRGWRGGLARNVWLGDGRPEYPGRLCSLMHVIVAKFDGSETEEHWEALLDPDVLRENVDGEALRWGVASLREIEASRRTLVVVSDGAPVDDSTLTTNGMGFLARDLHEAVEQVEGDKAIELHGIGLAYRTEDYYSSAHYLEDEESLVPTMERVLEVGDLP